MSKTIEYPKKCGIVNIDKAIKLYKMHIIILLEEIAKKVGESSHKLELEKAVFPAMKLELKKERIRGKTLILLYINFHFCSIVKPKT